MSEIWSKYCLVLLLDIILTAKLATLFLIISSSTGLSKGSSLIVWKLIFILFLSPNWLWFEVTSTSIDDPTSFGVQTYECPLFYSFLCQPWLIFVQTTLLGIATLRLLS
jgi:hypothetical protein